MQKIYRKRKQKELKQSSMRSVCSVWVYDNEWYRMQQLCDLFALLKAPSYELVIDYLPKDEAVVALLLSYVLSFKALTLIEFAFLSQAVTRMSLLDKSCIHAFFSHYYNRQWRLASYRYQPGQLPIVYDDEYPNKPEDIQWSNNEVIAVRVSQYSVDGKYLIYDGFWRNQQRHGEGTLFVDSQTYDELLTDSGTSHSHRFALCKQKGTFENGVLQGWGEEYDSYGHKLFEGMFQNGKREGKCVLYHNNRPCFSGFITTRTDSVPSTPNPLFADDLGEGEELYGEDVEEFDYHGVLQYRGTYKESQRTDEGVAFLSPHYFHVTTADPMGALQYQSIPDCVLEDLDRGEVLECTATKPSLKPFVDPDTHVLTPFLDSKAYFCTNSGWG